MTIFLSRSTYVGSRKYNAHRTCDNKETCEDLRYFISIALNFGIFGMRMVDANICSFYLTPTKELCNRWIEVSAFYPFSRDHSSVINGALIARSQHSVLTWKHFNDLSCSQARENRS